MTVLLQNATVITNCNNCITKCDSYYKMRRLLQIATIQGNTRKYLLITVANVINELKNILNSKFGKLNS